MTPYLEAIKAKTIREMKVIEHERAQREQLLVDRKQQALAQAIAGIEPADLQQYINPFAVGMIQRSDTNLVTIRVEIPGHHALLIRFEWFAHLDRWMQQVDPDQPWEVFLAAGRSLAFSTLGEALVAAEIRSCQG